MVSGWAEPVGIFDGHTDIGNPAPGTAVYSNDLADYEIEASGVELDTLQFSGQMIYKEISGDFLLRATMQSERGDSLSDVNTSGLLVMNEIQPTAMFLAAVAGLPGWAGVVTRDVADTEWQAKGWPLTGEDHDGRFEIVRKGNTFYTSYYDVPAQQWLLLDTHVMPFDDPVYVGFWTSSWDPGRYAYGLFFDVALEFDPEQPTWAPLPIPTPIQGPPVEQLPILSGPEAAGIRPITGDVSLWAGNGGINRFWRPDADTLSNGNLIVLGGMDKDPGYTGSVETEVKREARDMIAIFSPTGELLEPARTAFFTNAGEPWERTICVTRSDDKFYGLCADTVGGRSGDRYVVHTLAAPDAFPNAFPGYPPENDDADYHTAIQIVSNDGVPETPLINPWGDYVTVNGKIRGGTVRFLSNGSIVVNYEDRTTTDLGVKDEFYGRTGNARIVGLVILGPDGSIVKAPFAISSPSEERYSGNRFGLASGNGWFAVRYYDCTDGPTIVAFDNDGNELGDGNGRVYPAIDIPELLGSGGSRGDENGLEAIDDLLFITHVGDDSAGYLTKFRVDENGVSVLKTVRFPDHPAGTFRHNADLGVDSNANIIVLWQDQSALWQGFQRGRWEALARMFDVNLEPLTPSFCLFEVGNNTNIDEVHPLLGPGRTKQCRVAMNDDVIIAIACTNELPYADLESVVGFPQTGEDPYFTYTYIARLLENPFGGSAAHGWELF